MNDEASRRESLQAGRFAGLLACWPAGLPRFPFFDWGSTVAVLVFAHAGCLTAAEWQSGDGYRWRDLKVPGAGQPFLRRMPSSETGITFTNYLSEEKALESSVRTSGSGVAAGDVDGDGWCDLYFCGMENDNALYRNLGNGRFENVTAAAGVACAGQYSTGAALADIDGDGDLDLLVNSVGGGTRLFVNDGKGKFAESGNSGLVRRFGATSMALADIDGNGTLDLYVCNYAAVKIEDRPNAKFDAKTVDGKPVLIAIDGVPLTSPELTNRYYVDSERTVRELGEPDILYLNDGKGHFSPVSWTDGSFLDEQGQPLKLPPYDFGLSVMFRDMNGDRAPDIYVCNDLFPPDRIWINDGHGRFRALSNLAVRNTCRFAMGVDFADINRDGFDDFFVVDMLSREHARRKTQTVGVNSLFLPIGVIDNRPQYKRNTLFLNRGDGTFAEIAQLAGLDATEWSWMPLFLDVDLDGFEDVLVSTGHTRDSLNADAVEQILRGRRGRKLTDAEHRELKRKFFPILNLSNQAFRNRGDLTFEDKAHEWGFDQVGTSHGMCLADLDNDGDPEVIVNHLNEAAGIYRFESSAPRVAVRLRGQAPNTRGIGAKVKLLGGPVPQSQEMICGGRYLSSDDAVRMFATGQATSGLSLEVVWRNGATSTVSDVKPNRLYEVDEASSGGERGEVRSENGKASTPSHLSLHTSHPTRNSPPLFTDVSHLLQHTNEDAWFDDFARQPLLSRKLSQLGPGVSWFDLDADGRDDLIIGTGAGGRMAVFRNGGSGKFTPWKTPALERPLGRDQTTILGWRKANGTNALLAGAANYESEQLSGACVWEFDLKEDKIGGGFPGWEVSVGPLAMADVDGDGIPDLFVGGRVEAQKYPETPSSLLFRGTGDRFVIDEENCRRFALVGMVSGAVFSDLDGDGDADLVVACDWGPLKIFRNERGKLIPWDPIVEAGRVSVPESQQAGKPAGGNSPLPVFRPAGLQPLLPCALSKLTGWWNGVTTGDFDGDGRLDIVASNWGRNGKYQSFRSQPLRLVFGEWTVKGIIDVFEAYDDPGLKKTVPWAPYRVCRLLPWIAERFPTQTAFSTAGMTEILGERSQTGKTLEAVWLESTVFLNRGDHFEVRVLPVEAQFSPAFGVNVADMDGDGNEDIFLSQNFFAVDGDTSRYDAGRGLWLAGDGNGNFRPVDGRESGVTVYGEQRGSAVCDYDADGRIDLVVTQNGAETKLYHNTGARPGLRVRLSGPPANPLGIGTSIRWVTKEKTGPVREIHAGSGYWSQDSAVQVLASPQPADKLVVRWPGGKVVTTDVPAGAREITVRWEGGSK